MKAASIAFLDISSPFVYSCQLLAAQAPLHLRSN